MQLPGSGNQPGTTIPLVTTVAIVLLGAIAFAIPPARLEISVKTGQLGYLASHAQFSTLMASQLANDGYNMLAIDLTEADLAKGALWRRHLDKVAEVQFPIWAWVSSDKIDAKRLERIAGGANVSGLFLYGAGAAEKAKLVRKRFGGLAIVIVHKEGEPLPDGFDTAVALPLDRFLAADPSSFRVLMAGSLKRAQVEEARATAEGNYVVARIPLD